MDDSREPSLGITSPDRTRLLEDTGLMIVLWTVGGGVVFTCLWETLEITQVLLRGYAIHDDMALAVLVFLSGALFGLAHATAFGYLGRPNSVNTTAWKSQLLRGTLVAIPATAAAFAVTWPISLTSWSVQADESTAWLVPTLSWGMAALLVLSAAYGSRGVIGRAYARWPMRRLCMLLSAGVFLASLAIGLRLARAFTTPPEVEVMASMLLALLVTLWVAVPALTVAATITARYRAGATSPGPQVT